MLESAKRQKQIGEDIGTEAKASVDLIKRVDKAVETEGEEVVILSFLFNDVVIVSFSEFSIADGRIRATTEKVEEVEESSSTKWYAWLKIIVAFVVWFG
jgi:hypothetical protein